MTTVPSSFEKSDAVRALMVERWPGLRIQVLESTLVWIDGPAKEAVRLHLDEKNCTPEHDERWNIIRRYSNTAWALQRGPQFPAHDGTPWDAAEMVQYLQDHQDEVQTRNKAIMRNARELWTTDLCDLPAFAGDPDIHAQAEIAAGLRKSVGTISRTLFDLWLEKGGWQMSGILAGTAPGHV